MDHRRQRDGPGTGFRKDPKQGQVPNPSPVPCSVPSPNLSLCRFDRIMRYMARAPIVEAEALQEDPWTGISLPLPCLALTLALTLCRTLALTLSLTLALTLALL